MNSICTHTNSSQSDTLQVKSHFLVKQTATLLFRLTSSQFFDG